MAWVNLWPLAAQGSVKGWGEQVRPGLCVLVDESGEAAAPWLAVLAGALQPSQGHVQCSGLCSQRDRAAYQAQVYWHQPRGSAWEPETVAQQWLHDVAQGWPTWSDAAWHKHCEGFGLAPYLDKPLGHLSTGSLRKLGLAAALSSGARLTLIEEPIAALDGPSIRYLCQALDALGEALASEPESPRWIIVSHWEPLAGVTWDEVLTTPSVAQSRTAST